MILVYFKQIKPQIELIIIKLISIISIYIRHLTDIIDLMKIGKIVKTTAIILTTVAATSLVTPTADANHQWGHYGSSSNTWKTYGNTSYGSNSNTGARKTCKMYGNTTYCN
jgi:hypothetical protein